MEKMETATNVPAIQNDTGMETAEEREFDSILVLHVKDAEQSIALGLTKLQTFIVVKSILKQDADGNAIMISDEELIRCRDRERPLNHNLFSMRDMPEAVLADLKEWGVPIEMLEHVTSVCRTKSPSRSDLVNILAHSDASPVQQYQKMLRMHNVTLQIPVQVLETVADKALEQEMGAHALASILEKAITPVMFRLAGNRKRMTLRLQPECFTAGKAPKLLPIKAS